MADHFFQNEGIVGLLYKKLTVIGAIGRFEDSFDILRRNLAADSQLEVAPIKRERYNKLLKAFDPVQPILDIELLQDRSGSAIIINSLDAVKSRKKLIELATRLNFSINPAPDSGFRAAVKEEFDREVYAYRQCEAAAEAGARKIEDLYAMGCYANFLITYNGSEPAAGARIAAQKFNIPWDI